METSIWSTVPWGLVFAYFGVAFSASLAGMGSAAGVSIAANAADGVMAEDPDKFGQLVVLVALPGTQGIYGLLTGFLILLKIGGISDTQETISIAQGLALFAGSLPMGIVGYASGVAQGRAAAAGIGMVARRPEESGKAITTTVLVETYAVLALLISFLVVQFVNMV